MHEFMEGCARAALALGAGALLLAAVPTHAGPTPGGSVIAPATASRTSQPLLIAQSAAQQEEAAQLEKRRQQEQQKLVQEQQKQQQMKSKEMRRAMPKAAAPQATPAPEAAPPKIDGKRFGAGVIRDKESSEGE